MSDALDRHTMGVIAATLDADGPAEVAACHRDFDPAVLRLASLLTADGHRALSVAEVVDLWFLLRKATRHPGPLDA